jgi:hypothetical protein
MEILRCDAGIPMDAARALAEKGRACDGQGYMEATRQTLAAADNKSIEILLGWAATGSQTMQGAFADTGNAASAIDATIFQIAAAALSRELELRAVKQKQEANDEDADA